MIRLLGRRGSLDRKRQINAEPPGVSAIGADAASRYKKIVADPESMDDLLVDLFLEAHDTSPAEILANLQSRLRLTHGSESYGFLCTHPWCLQLILHDLVSIHNRTRYDSSRQSRNHNRTRFHLLNPH